MSAALNRTTRQYLLSVNTPEYPLTDWIINPNLSAVEGFASKYWVITGDVVSLMTPAQRAAVDAAAVTAMRNITANRLDATEGIERAMLAVMLDEINILRAQAGLGARTAAQLKTALRSKLGT